MFLKLGRHKQTDAFSLPGPHGYPVRFAVRLAGPKGFKIYGADSKEPLQYIECHTRRQVLHASGHKADKSPALATTQSNWPSWTIRPIDANVPAFTITLHSNHTTQAASPHPDGYEATGNEVTNAETTGDTVPSDTTVDLIHTLCHPVTFQFSLPIPTTTTNNTTVGNTTLETFEWRRAPHACHETRSIRKKTLPLTETGDERPPEERFVYAPSGSILVRLNTTTNNNNNNNNNRRPHADAGTKQPVGYTPQGEEIVASYTNSRDYHAWVYFQFWGPGATGELGEAFTRVAVMSGLAVWQDEEDEKGRRKKAGSLLGDGRAREVHGVAPVLASGMPRKEEWPGAGGDGSRFGVHLVQHGSHGPGHLAAQCGML